ncbi:MAG: hypothetical protein JWM33_1267 [Caulobacteraceae bacterium]|nr:hypothetical protein [Caulobacteraceae bacterium]
MTCCQPDKAKRGFATLAAAVLCLSLAMMAVALTEAASLDLRASRARFDQFQAQYALDGAHRIAVQALLEANPAGRFTFSLDGDGGPVEVVAEPEAPKLAAGDAAQLDDQLLDRMGVRDPGRLRQALAALADRPDANPISALDSAPAWQACAPSLISAFGRADQLTPMPLQSSPRSRFSARGGEVWRLRLTDSQGWTDERWVRFTADARRPAATIIRDFRQSSPVGTQCDPYLG